MDAATMSLELHERGIHVVCSAGRGQREMYLLARYGPSRRQSNLAVFATGKRGIADFTDVPSAFSIAFRASPGTILPCAGTGDRRVIGMTVRS